MAAADAFSVGGAFACCWVSVAPRSGVETTARRGALGSPGAAGCFGWAADEGLARGAGFVSGDCSRTPTPTVPAATLLPSATQAKSFTQEVEPAAAALREAQNTVRSETGTGHPFFWAGFVLVGAGEVRVPLHWKGSEWLIGLTVLLCLAAVGAAILRRRE